MKIKATKTLTVVILVVSLLFSMSVTAFAATPEAAAASAKNPISVNTVGGVSMAFNSISSTQARADVMASSNGETPYITSKITLQVSADGGSSWMSITTDTKTVYDLTYIWHTAYFGITQDLDYRIKVQLTDEVNGIKTTTTWYRNLD